MLVWLPFLPAKAPGWGFIAVGAWLKTIHVFKRGHLNSSVKRAKENAVKAGLEEVLPGPA